MGTKSRELSEFFLPWRPARSLPGRAVESLQWGLATSTSQVGKDKTRAAGSGGSEGIPDGKENVGRNMLRTHTERGAGG